jgi:hypothetical protein
VMQSAFFITYLLSLRWETDNMDKRIGLLSPIEFQLLVCPSLGSDLGHFRFGTS